MLDWVSSEALVGMEWGERLPNTVPDLIALGSFHVKSTQKNPYPHQFERKLVPI